MKTNYALIITGLSCSLCAQAQVNLDKPISIGPSDHVYASIADPKAAYYIPISLDRNADVTITKLDDRMVARFGVGVNSQLFHAVQATLDQNKSGLQLRMIRPVNPVLQTGTDVPDDFTPSITSIGEVDLMGPSLFSINVDRKYRLFTRDGGEKLFDQLFGDGGRDHVGSIVYEFDSIQGGKPWLAQTSVAIFGTQHHLPATGGNPGLLAEEVDTLADTTAPAPEFLLDRDSKCWNSVKPGQYCLREK